MRKKLPFFKELEEKIYAKNLTVPLSYKKNNFIAIFFMNLKKKLRMDNEHFAVCAKVWTIHTYPGRGSGF